MFSALADLQRDKNQVLIQDRLSIFIGLAPIVNMYYIPSSVLQEGGYHWRLLYDLLTSVGVYEIRDPATEQALMDICGLPIISSLCALLSKRFQKKTPFEDQASWDLLNTLPQSSASTKQLIHYAQII